MRIMSYDCKRFNEFEDMLAEAGVPKEFFDVEDLAGLTAKEIEPEVRCAIWKWNNGGKENFNNVKLDVFNNAEELLVGNTMYAPDNWEKVSIRGDKALVYKNGFYAEYSVKGKTVHVGNKCVYGG